MYSSTLMSSCVEIFAIPDISYGGNFDTFRKKKKKLVAFNKYINRVKGTIIHFLL